MQQPGGHRFQMGGGHHWPPAGDGPGGRGIVGVTPLIVTQ